MQIKKQSGLSLLESLLVIAVIGVVLVLTMRYFSAVHFNQQVSQAQAQLKTLSQASYRWLGAQQQADFGSGPEKISLSMLEQTGLIESAEEHDPWGGSVNVLPGQDTSYVRITFHDVPTAACESLRQHLSVVAHAQSSDDDCKEGTSYFIEM